MTAPAEYISPERAAKLESLFAAGMTRSQVATEMGVPLGQVRNMIGKYRSALGKDLPGHGGRTSQAAMSARMSASIRKAWQRRRSAAVDPERCPHCHLILPCEPDGGSCRSSLGHAATARRGRGAAITLALNW